MKSEWLVSFLFISRARKAEYDSMSEGDIFQSFYAQLDEIQKYHKKFPGLVEKPVYSVSSS